MLFMQYLLFYKYIRPALWVFFQVFSFIYRKTCILISANSLLRTCHFVQAANCNEEFLPSFILLLLPPVLFSHFFDKQDPGYSPPCFSSFLTHWSEWFLHSHRCCAVVGFLSKMLMGGSRWSIPHCLFMWVFCIYRNFGSFDSAA